MEKKKVTPFEFKKITREETPNNPSSTVKPSISSQEIGKKTYRKAKNDKELLQNIGDKDNLTSLDEKYEVIDYIFKKNDNPLIICGACGNKIHSQYFVSHSSHKDIIFCPGCYQSLAGCDNCGMPMKPVGPTLRINYCQYCKVTKACGCCGDAITSKQSYRIPFVKGTFCHKCFLRAGRCAICLTPILTDSNSIFVGGKKLCMACNKRKITQAEALELNKGVIRLLNQQFGISETIQCTVLLTSFRRVNPIGQSEALGRFLKVSNRSVLALYDGVTRERAIGVFAYEYGKYIYKRLNPSVQNDNIRHSFSLWIKSLTLRDYGELDEVSQIKGGIDKDPILKSLLNIERLGGIKRVLDKVVAGEVGRK
ncbi:MAG TPA: hypothetical protein ENI73_07675 [Spirochaetes bacterium]|nr:hypothetical protein [Spirochaetota bacterium]